MPIEKNQFVLNTCFLAVRHIENIVNLRSAGFTLGFHSRFLSTLLHPESELICKGMSKTVFENEKIKTRWEHIVPMIFMCNHIFNLLSEKQHTADDLAHILYKNIGVARISADEATRLDQKPINLKTKMPEGWQFGDDPILRLHVADIILVDGHGNEIDSLL